VPIPSNTIHDIGPVAFTGNLPGSAGNKFYLSMPTTVTVGCRKYVNSLGLPEDSGLIEAFEDTSFDPVALANRLVDIALDKLDLLLRAIPWEEFGSDERTLATVGTHPMYSEESGEFAKACFGLGAKPRDADSKAARRDREHRATRRRAAAVRAATTGSDGQ
jgi:hypothetical protein